jgi:hypothetical protein
MHSRVSAAAAAALASEEILRTWPKSLARRHALTAEHSTGNSALALLRKAPVGHRYFNVAGRPLLHMIHHPSYGFPKRAGSNAHSVRLRNDHGVEGVQRSDRFCDVGGVDAR